MLRRPEQPKTNSHRNRRPRRAVLPTRRLPGNRTNPQSPSPKIKPKQRAMAATTQPEQTPRQIAEDESGGRMSFFEHLVDLRKRLVSSLISIGIGAIIGLSISKHFITFIIK